MTLAFDTESNLSWIDTAYSCSYSLSVTATELVWFYVYNIILQF